MHLMKTHGMPRADIRSERHTKDVAGTTQMNLTLREDKRASKEAGEFFKLFLTSMSRISVFDDFWIKATGLAQFHIHTQPQKTTRA